MPLHPRLLPFLFIFFNNALFFFPSKSFTYISEHNKDGLCLADVSTCSPCVQLSIIRGFSGPSGIPPTVSLKSKVARQIADRKLCSSLTLVFPARQSSWGQIFGDSQCQDLSSIAWGEFLMSGLEF